MNISPRTAFHSMYPFIRISTRAKYSYVSGTTLRCHRPTFKFSVCQAPIFARPNSTFPDGEDILQKLGMASNLKDKYKNWTRLDIIDRLALAESELRLRGIDLDALLGEARKAKASKQQAKEVEEEEKEEAALSHRQRKRMARGKGVDIDPSKYSTRYIALRLAYLGKNYGGFEFQASSDVVTVEEELWKALCTARLIFPKDVRDIDFDCCDYSKCGRTDRGVSAFGQVVSLRVRSNRPLQKADVPLEGKEVGLPSPERVAETQEESTTTASTPHFDNIRDEIRYVSSLNKLLPPDIRILAWCPSPREGFTARFSCRERRYKYFFTQPAYPPAPPHLGPAACNGWLDIEKMREAARLFEGSHDFRNFCKVDAAKQITNFERHIFHAGIHEVEDAETALPYLRSRGLVSGQDANLPHGRLPKVYSFDVHGTAFLWHQIRCMVAILFLVGQGLEKPELITDMLDIKKTPTRTAYIMADEVPLVLWDCIFPEPGDPERRESLRWVYPSEECPDLAICAVALSDTAWSLWRERKVDEILAAQFVQLVNEKDPPGSGPRLTEGKKMKALTDRVFDGGNSARVTGRYVPVMKLRKMLSVDEQNEIHAKKKGYANMEELKKAMREKAIAKKQAAAAAAANDTQI